MQNLRVIGVGVGLGISMGLDKGHMELLFGIGCCMIIELVLLSVVWIGNGDTASIGIISLGVTSLDRSRSIWSFHLQFATCTLHLSSRSSANA